VLNINGRKRDYLLNAWYKRGLNLSDRNKLSAAFGIIDAADYLDGNAYANDEYTQYMNAALTNAPNVFFPSYDMGGALQWEREQWSFGAVVMNVGENDDGNSYMFYGAQAAVTVNTPLGEGHYRLMVDRTNKSFLDVSGNTLERRTALMLNFDQALGRIVGAFIRIGWQDNKAAIDYEAIYSGGIDIKGSAWGRADDNIGIGYAFLDGGNLEVKQSQVAEAYYRLIANDHLALSGDVQYLQDNLHDAPGLEGFIVGLRLLADF
jgi:porin